MSGRTIPQFQDAVARFERGDREGIDELRELACQLPKGTAFTVTGERSAFHFTPERVTRTSYTAPGLQVVAEWQT